MLLFIYLFCFAILHVDIIFVRFYGHQLNINTVLYWRIFIVHAADEIYIYYINFCTTYMYIVLYEAIKKT